MLELESDEGTGAPPKRRPGKPDSELVSIPYFHLDLVSGSVDLFGQRHWELRSPWRKGKRPLNTGAAPHIPIRVPLSGILEANPAQKYYLSKTACIGILRRAVERGKELPQKLERALRIQAGLMRPDGQPTDLDAFHINQRDEGIDLHGVSGALLATTNMQMQTFVTQPDEAVEGFDGYNGDLTGDVAATLGVNCGMSTGRNGIMAFAANQRDEVRDLHDVAGALQASPGMKQQTFVAEDGIAFTGSILQSSFLESNTVGTQMANQSKCYNTLLLPRNPAVFGQQTYGSYAPGFSTLAATGGTLGYGGESLVVDDADASAQPRFDRSCEGFAAGIVTKGNGDCFLSEDLHTALSTGGGQAGQGYPCVLTAAFSAGAGASAGGIGYGEELSPTLKGSAGGNCMPSVLCLNDQGSSVMNCSENVSGTLRAQEHGHQPLVYENHGVDSRYTGPHKVAPTMSARYGTGGNNVPLVEQDAGTICIAGNTVDRQPQNGGNGLGCQDDLAYTLTATDRHAVYSRQRVDDFRHNDVASTQSARQYKDATDLICQQAEACAHLIRRLTPLECERLQGFPDGWTDIPGASDSARYKALGNSVAIPCVEFIMSRIAAALL